VIFHDLLPICILITNSINNSSLYFADGEDDFDFGLTSKKEIDGSSNDYEMIRGVPGVELVKIDKDMITYRPLHPFAIGEIVAIKEKDSSKYIYGKILSISGPIGAIETLPSSSLVSVSSENQQHQQQGNWIKRLRIIIQEFPTQKVEDLLSTEVMCFRSTSSNNSSNNSQHSALKFEVVNDDTKEEVLSSSIYNHIPREVSQEEANKAMKDVMIRLGLNPSLEQSKLLEENMRLAQTLERIQQTTQSAQSKLQELLEENERLKTANICKICLDKTVSKILIPCGHLICNECHSRLGKNQCPFDRQKVSSIANFFPQ